MKVVVFEVEPREATAFDVLKAQNEIVLVEAPLRAANVASFPDAEVISIFVCSELDRRVLETLPAVKTDRDPINQRRSHRYRLLRRARHHRLERAKLWRENSGRVCLRTAAYDQPPDA